MAVQCSWFILQACRSTARSGSCWRFGATETASSPVRRSSPATSSNFPIRKSFWANWSIPAPPSAPPAEPLAHFDNGFTLDTVSLPATAHAGDTLNINSPGAATAPGSEDHIQFLHLGHAETGEWFVYDQQPLGARLPTRLWYSGLADSEVWSVPLPADLAPGRYDVFTGFYRARDGERVPATDADGAPWLDARVKLGSSIIE